jgi:hypothetical protein
MHTDVVLTDRPFSILVIKEINVRENRSDNQKW